MWHILQQVATVASCKPQDHKFDRWLNVSTVTIRMTKSHSKHHKKKEFNSASSAGHGFKNRYSLQDNQERSHPSKRDHHPNQKKLSSNDQQLLKQPSKIFLKSTDEIFDPAIVAKYMLWETSSKAGPGLNNHGNTCFLNSTLQCLLHTPALSQILLKESQMALRGLDRNSSQQTILQYYQRLVVDVWTPSSKRKTLSPRTMVQNIRRVGKQFRPNRQEDAHEYLRQLLDCMHEEILKAHNIKTSDGKIAETTFISRVFGGYLRNELKCSVCTFSSKTYNHFLDLSLEVTGGVSDVTSALKAFIKIEKLSSGNEWFCDQCKKKVKASKQMTINKSPNVLVLHLKRFSFGGVSGKINKNISKKNISYNLL